MPFGVLGSTPTGERVHCLRLAACRQPVGSLLPADRRECRRLDAPGLVVVLALPGTRARNCISTWKDAVSARREASDGGDPALSIGSFLQEAIALTSVEAAV